MLQKIIKHTDSVNTFIRARYNRSHCHLSIIAACYLLFTGYTTAFSQDIQKPDSLHHYLEVAARNNPLVKADFLAYEAALQKVPQAGTYEDPQLEIGFFLKPMEILGGRQVADIKLMQMFPWFGTRKAARTEAAHMAQMSFEQFRETTNNLYFEVYSQWFVLCNLKQRYINTQANKEILTYLETLALRKFSSPANSNPGTTSASTGSSGNAAGSPAAGSGGGMSGMGGMGGSTNVAANTGGSSGSPDMGGMSSSMGSASSGMSDVLRIQLELAELESTMASIESETKAATAKFNALLNRPASTFVSIPDSFEPLTLSFEEDSIMSILTEKNPMLAMISEEGLAYKAKSEMDRKMSYPMFGIGLSYMLINKSPEGAMGSMDDMNGKDMVMPMVSVTLPLYRKKYKAQQKEGQLWWQSSQEKYTNTLNTLNSEYYLIRYQMDDAARKIALYKKQSELAHTTYNLMIREFSAGVSDLTTVIQVQRQLLDYQLKTSEAVASYNTMLASLQNLISHSPIE